MSEGLQLWVRNDKGKVYGPLTPVSIELLIDNGIVEGKVQVSLDGVTYVYPGRVPGVRMIFRKELWGDVVVPGDDVDAQWGKVSVPPPINPADGAAGAAPAAGPGVPAAGPGVPAAGPGVPMAGPGVPRAGPGVPRAGPGARPAAGPGARPTAGPGARPGPPVARPGHPPGARPGGSAPSAIASAPSSIGSSPGPVDDAGMDAILKAFGAAGTDVSATRLSKMAPSGEQTGSGSVKVDSLLDSFDFSDSASKPKSSAPAAARGAPSGVRKAAPQADVVAAVSMDMPASGTIGSPSPPRLYFLAAAGELTGLLTLKLPDAEVRWHFRKGNPEFLDSTHADDALAQFLVRAKLVTFDQLGQAEQQKGRFGGELLPALFALGLVNPNEAFAKLGQRAGDILRRGLLAEQGTFTWQAMELPPEKAMPLGNKWQLFMEQLRKAPGPDVYRRLGPAVDLPVMRSGGAVDVSMLRLSPKETRVLQHFDGVRSLGQLLEAQADDRDTLLHAAWMLKECDVVAFAAEPVSNTYNAAGPPPAAAPRVAPAAPPPPSGPPRIAPAGAPPVAPGPPVVAAPAGPPVISAQPAAAPGPPVISAPKAGGVPPVPGAPRPPPGAPAAARPPPGAPAVPGNPVRAPAPQSMPYPGGRTPGPPVVAPSAGRPPVSGPSGVNRAPPVMTPSGARAAPAAAPAVPTGAEVRQLVELLEKMKQQTHFEVLGLAKESEIGAVKMAYLKLARSYHPDTVPPGSPAELAKAKADIFARIGDANRVLSDPALRAEYIGELDAGGTGEKVDVAAILAAEEQFQKAQILVKARKYAEAVKMVDEAIKANPDEGEFYALRGFARFFAFPDKREGQRVAMMDINECLKRNPNVAEAWYYQGFMAKAQGDAAGAKKHFQKCVSLNKSHVDAQRELRMMK